MDKDRIAGSVKEFAGKAEAAAGDAIKDADTQAAGRVREAAGKVQDLYGQGKDAAREAVDTAVNYARGDGAEAIAKLVHQNPLGSLLTAGAIGFGLALLMARPAPRPKRRWYYN